MSIAEIFSAPTHQLQEHIVAYIRLHFQDVLGPYVSLLDEPDGLERLAEVVRSGRLSAGS